MYKNVVNNNPMLCWVLQNLLNKFLLLFCLYLCFGDIKLEVRFILLLVLAFLFGPKLYKFLIKLKDD